MDSIFHERRQLLHKQNEMIRQKLEQAKPVLGDIKEQTYEQSLADQQDSSIYKVRNEPIVTSQLITQQLGTVQEIINEHHLRASKLQSQYMIQEAIHFEDVVSQPNYKQRQKYLTKRFNDVYKKLEKEQQEEQLLIRREQQLKQEQQTLKENQKQKQNPKTKSLSQAPRQLPKNTIRKEPIATILQESMEESVYPDTNPIPPRDPNIPYQQLDVLAQLNKEYHDKNQPIPAKIKLPDTRIVIQVKSQPKKQLDPQYKQFSQDMFKLTDQYRKGKLKAQLDSGDGSKQ